MEKKIIEKFGKRLRVRVCGILIEKNRLLLVRHLNVGKLGILWIPPGGGMEFGDSAEDNLKREFLEETGLEIKVLKHLFTHEYLQPPLHAVELFFEVKRTGGKLSKGRDPEMNKNEQIIQEVKFIDDEMFMNIPRAQLHDVLKNIKKIGDVLKIKGYIKF